MIDIRHTREGLLVLESATKHHLNAQVHLSTTYPHAERYTLVYHRNRFYEWTGTYWAELPTDTLKRRLQWDFTRAVVEKIVKDENGEDKLTLVEYSPNKAKYAELIEAIQLAVGVDPRTDTPAFIDEEGHADADPDAQDLARNIISCANGLVDTRSRTLLEHTPRFFNLSGLDFDYDPDLSPPAAWLAFLDSIWGHDPQSIDTLQEVMGYLLTPRTEQHKMFMIVGPPRSGKGTITNVITALLGGEKNVSSVTMSDLNTNFGIADLLGKSLATMTDLRFRSRDDGMAVSRLLAITGGDMVGVSQKYKDSINAHLPTRFLIASNELPQLRDESGALQSRLMILKMTKSFVGREDRELAGRLDAELASIFNWALEGLARLNARGRFLQPDSAAGDLAVMGALSSPISVFLEDCCEVGERLEVARKELFAVWGEWARQAGQFVGSDIAFGRNIRSVVPGLGDVKRGPMGGQVRHYTGVGLNDYGRKLLAMDPLRLMGQLRSNTQSAPEDPELPPI